MLWETLKQELDRLSNAELEVIADVIAGLKSRLQRVTAAPAVSPPRTQAEAFRQWVAQLPKTGHSLTDEAFDRGHSYD